MYRVTDRIKARTIVVAVAAAWVSIALQGCEQPVTAPPEERPTATTPTTPALPRTGPPQPADRSIYDAATLTRIDRLAQFVVQNPARARHWRELGELYHQLQEYEAALACYEAALNLDAPSARLHYFAALVMHRFGRHDQAVVHLEEATRLAPDYAPAKWRLGLYHLEQGNLDFAERAAREAMAIDENDALAPLVLARALLQLDRAEEAAETLERAIERRASDPYAHTLLATAYRELGRHDAAQHQAVLARGASPQWRDPWRDEVEGLAHGRRAKLPEAIALMNQGQVDAAIAMLEELAAQLPDDATVLINLGLAYRHMERLEDAIAQFEQALTVEQHELAYFHLAGTYRQMSGRQNPPDPATLRTALHYADEVVRMKPTFAGGHGMRGELLRYLGEPNESYAAFSEAIRLEHDNPLWLSKRGLLMASQNRWGEAAQDFYRQLQLSPRDPEAHLLLGGSLANIGRLDDAERVLEAGFKLAPNHPQIHSTLAQVRIARRAQQEAPKP